MLPRRLDVEKKLLLVGKSKFSEIDATPFALNRDHHLCFIRYVPSNVFSHPIFLPISFPFPPATVTKSAIQHLLSVILFQLTYFRLCASKIEA